MRGFKNYITEAAAGGFDQIILDTLDEKERVVHGRYSLQANSFKMTIDRRDQEAFKKLFKKAPDKTVGNGEISLYWLFNYGSTGRNRAQETRGGNEPDLKIDGKSVEVKAYPKHDPISLGRFQDRRQFRSMVNTLFGVKNLYEAFEGGGGRGEQKFVGELAFRYPDLLDAAEKFLALKALINDNKGLQQFEIFKTFMKTINQFDAELKTISNKRVKTANDIAVVLMTHLIEVSVGDKPGDKGYIVNLKDKDPLDIYFHYIDFNHITTDAKILTQKGTFTINGGVFKANFSRLFPGK